MALNGLRTACTAARVLLDGNAQAVRRRHGAIQVALSRHVGVIVGVAFLSYAASEGFAAFLGYRAPVTTITRVLPSMCITLAAACYWLNANFRVLRLLIRRARYSCAP